MTFCVITDKPYFLELVKKLDANTSLLVNWNMHIKDPKKLEQVGDEIRKIYTNTKLQDDLGGAIRVWPKIYLN